MKVAIIYNKDTSGVINTFGMQNKEFYNEETVQKVSESLEKGGHNVSILDGNKQIIERLENFMPKISEGEPMGMVFNMAYGIQGESRYTHIPSLLEMLGLPYVGSSPSGHALALDKVLTKIIWKNHGLPTPDFWVFNSSADDMSGVNFPVIVKPKMESVSFGLRVVNNLADLKDAVEFIISEFNQPALVEEFIRGREFCVGLLGNSPVEAFPVLEIDLEGNPDAIQTVDDKKLKPRRKICPADIPNELAEKMQKISIEAFKALNLRDFARVDIRLDENNQIHLLEINSMASLGETGSYISAAKVAGYDFASLVNRMLEVAAIRYFSAIWPAVKTEKPANGYASRWRAFLKARANRTERFLKKIVDADSFVRNVEGVNYCTALIASEFSQLGFNREIYPQIEVGNIFYFTNSSHQELDYLIIQSIDTGIDLPKHEHFQENEQYLEGTGIWENKGGITILLAALQTLKFAKALKKIRFGILITTDSHIDNKYSYNIIQEKAQKAKRVLSLSGSSKRGGLVLSRSGSALYNLEIKLKDRSKAENIALTALQFNKVMAKIVAISQNDPQVIIAPFQESFKSNIFKRTAHGLAGISIRFSNNEDLILIDEKIRRAVRSAKKQNIFQIKVEGGLKRPALAKNNATSIFYSKIEKLAKQIDVRINQEHRWSSSDICFIPDGIAMLDGLGPVGEYNTTGNERILRHSLHERALLLTLILLNKL